MSIVIFIVILLVLVIGHEFGHFIVAKLSGMEVPEFGIGFPPKLWGKKIGDTEYTVNALPFGGFVRITGEDISKETIDDPKAFSNRPKISQALTLLAGPLANILIALILSSLSFLVGVPAATNAGFDASRISAAHVTVIDVLPGSPSDKAGIKAGDEIVSLSTPGTNTHITDPAQISSLISNANGPIKISLLRGTKPLLVTLTPLKGIVKGQADKPAIGIATASVGILTLPFFQAIGAGFKETILNFENTLVGIFSLIRQAFTFQAHLSNVAGPVGIAHLVGTAANFGFGSILSFAALISINLGVINLFPFPALDGGRFTFFAIEVLSRRKIPPKVANSVNTVGFALLITLMLAVTAHDIYRLVG